MSQETKNENAQPETEGMQNVTDTEATEECEPQVEEAEEKDPVQELEDKLKAAEAERLRAMADLENTKKRLIRENEEFRKYACESVIADLLPVLDNLDLALAHGSPDEACKNFVMGVEMTRKVFLDTLAKHGLEAVGNVGDQFDPQWAEAVGMEDREDAEDNTVVSIMQRGYTLKGRIVRPARVVICKKS